MQKLIELVRQGKIDEIKLLISNKPELINSVSGPKPKKDHGQSLLQVAFKTGQLDVAEYLIDAGIDLNFIEAEDDDPGLRAPVLFDAINAVLSSLCVGIFCKPEEIMHKFDASDKALSLMKRMIRNGSDITKESANGITAVNWALHRGGINNGASQYISQLTRKSS